MGGPAMIRAAAKNHDDVVVIVDMDDYPALMEELRRGEGTTRLAFRRRNGAEGLRPHGGL